MSLLTSENYEIFEEIVDELRVLLGEKGVTGVLIEVHRGPLSKSIREFGDCLCPTRQESDIVIKVRNEHPEALRLADEMIEWIDGPAFHVPHYVVRDAAKELRRLHEENEALRKPSGYAGVTIWIGNKRITQIVTEPQIKYEREAGFFITAAAQYCLDALAKAKEQT